ncbi:MAG: RlmE family RNA methyltransferase [Desulfobacterales bacterium]
MKQKKAKSGQRDRARPDYYAKKAKKEHFPARSVYKLSEIQKKYKVIKPGYTVLDLGCAPGSWLRYTADVVGKSGRVIGVDLKSADVEPSDNMFIFREDINELSSDAWDVIDQGVDAVLSDMAPSTTGRKDVDAARSEQLCEMALYVADRALCPGGSFVCKIFQGPGFKEFSEAAKARFKTMKIFKPSSCRKDSREIYIIGTGKKQEE